MSEVEKMFYAVQAKTGGNLQWEELDGFQQTQFVAAANYIIQACSFRKAEDEANSKD